MFERIDALVSLRVEEKLSRGKRFVPAAFTFLFGSQNSTCV